MGSARIVENEDNDFLSVRAADGSIWVSFTTSTKLAPYLVKGRPIFVSGVVSGYSQYGLDLYAARVQFFDKAPDATQPQEDEEPIQF